MRENVFILYLKCSFNCRSCCKSPAWSTLSLVLNFINSSFFSPVYWITEVIILKINCLIFLLRCLQFQSFIFFCFKFCHSRKHIVPNFKRFLALIYLINFSIHFLIKLKSELILFLCSKSKPKFLNMLNEILFKKRKFIL